MIAYCRSPDRRCCGVPQTIQVQRGVCRGPGVSPRLREKAGSRLGNSVNPCASSKEPGGPTLLSKLMRRLPRSVAAFITYALAVCATAWERLDKVTLSVGPWQVQFPRLYSPGPMSIFGYLLLSICVVAVLFVLMDQARALTNACIKWQLSR